MSDAYYQEQAARRTRWLLIVGGAVIIVACIVAVVVSLFYDACTRGFDRSPQAVVEAYVQAVAGGDWETAQECWEHETFYNLEVGCSEVCLTKALGGGYQGVNLVLGLPQTTASGRANLLATVSLTCPESGEQHQAEILLDSVGGNLPWKHWAIIRSSLGGSVAEPWCK